MKKLLLLPLLALLLAAGCTSKEEERNALFNNALGMEESGNYAEARATARKALELDPGFALAYLLLGRCDMEDKNMDGAAVNFTRALELAPDNLEALENLSRINLIKGELKKAEEFASKAAALSPASTEVKVIRAGIFMRKEDYAQAKPLLEQVLAADPKNEEALVGLATIAINTGEADKAKDLLKGALSQDEPSSAVLSLLTNIAMRDDDLASAEGYIKKLMEVNDSDEQLPLHLAGLYEASNREQEAVSLLNGYLEKHPESLAVRTRLTEMSLADGNFPQALGILDKAPKETPAIRLLRAGVLTQAGKIDEAVPILRALADDPKTDKETSAGAQVGLASIFLQQNKSAEAEKELTALIAQDPANAQALFMRGGIYFNERRFAKALADMEKVVELVPDDPAAYLGMADVHNAAGNQGQAEKIISDTIVRFPEYAPAYSVLANLHMAHKRPEAALMTLDIGKNAVKDNAEIILAECDILISLKRYDEAQSLLNDLAKRDEYRVIAKLRLAEMNMSRDRFTIASRIYEEILKDNPGVQAAVEGVIQALISANKPKEAMAFAEKRQNSYPEDAMAAYLYAETALLNKENAKAEKAFLRSLELEPQWDQPLTRLAQVYAATGRLDDAIKLCDSILEKHPDAMGPGVLKGILLEQKGPLEDAEAQYRKVLAAHKDNILASNNLAYLLSRHKPDPARLREAEELARQATASGAPATFDTLGWIQHLLGKNEDAEQNLRKAHENIQNNPTVAYHLAVVLASAGKKEKTGEAIQILEKITSAKDAQFPQQGDAQKLLKKLKPGK